MGKTLRRYVAREVLGGFLTGLVLFTFVLLVARILDVVDLIVARGIPAAQVLRLIGYILPSFLEIAIPTAVLLGVVTAFGRLSADGEMLALRAAGVSLYQMVPTVAALGAAAAAGTLAISGWAGPWAQRNVSAALYDIAKTRATAAVRPAMFNSLADGVVLFVENVDAASGRFDGILLADERDPTARTTVVAGSAYVMPERGTNRLFLHLRDGTSFTTRTGDSYDTTAFGALEVNLDLTGLVAATESGGDRPPEQMFVDELLAASSAVARRDARASTRNDGAAHRRAEQASLELHRRASFAVAALVLAVAGVPLGLRPSRSVRARGLATSLIVVLLYYVALTGSFTLARRGSLDPAFAAWLPDGALALAALAMLWRAGADRPPIPPLRRVVRGLAPARRLAPS